MDHDCNSLFGILLVAGCCCFPAVFFPNGNLESMSAAYNPLQPIQLIIIYVWSFWGVMKHAVFKFQVSFICRGGDVGRLSFRVKQEIWIRKGISNPVSLLPNTAQAFF
jgi:hypothetical protein